jgi:predicted transcriptional regulator
MNAVDMKPVSFRTSLSRLRKIDALAETQQRDRTFILNEAIDHYLAIQEYHAGLIEDGIRDAEAGRVVSHEDIRRDLAAQRVSRKSKTAH